MYNIKLWFIVLSIAFSVLECNAQTVTTIGTGLQLPTGVAVDASGNVYVTNRAGNAYEPGGSGVIIMGSAIKKIPPGGGVLSLSTNATTISANYEYEHGIALDNTGWFYIADFRHIDKFYLSGNSSTLAGVINQHESYGEGPYCSNGTGTNARFGLPVAIAINLQTRDLYVADYRCNNIRKVTQAGIVTTFAGSNLGGIADGTGTSASFNGPSGVAVDAQGNIFVADKLNNRIRKISPAGVVTTFAGSGSTGAVNGLGLAASFNHPTGVAVDTQGNVFVTDCDNNLIRKITPAGLVSTYAGSGTAGSTDGIGVAASFNKPAGIAVDTNGTLYVADYQSGKVRKITKPPVRITRNIGEATTISTATINTRAFTTPSECNCGSWETRKITYRNAVNDLICNASFTLIKDTNAIFDLKRNCSPTSTSCVTKYEAEITTPAGVVTTVQITNNSNWSYLFNQLGNYTITFKTYCNDTLCPDSCTYTITSK